jgi:hypothetical protein
LHFRIINVPVKIQPANFLALLRRVSVAQRTSPSAKPTPIGASLILVW